METQNKTALDIVQELIAIHTTRKDAVDKLSVKSNAERKQVMASAKQQSDYFIEELLTELSTFGDLVQDSPDRDNEYQHLWKNELSNLESLTSEEAAGIFSKLESALKEIYSTVMETKELPETLMQILSSQKEQLLD